MIAATITFMAGLYIMYKAVLALNKMDRNTRHMVRAAYVCLASTGVAFMLAGFSMRYIYVAVAALGVALYLAGNRRKGEVNNGY